MTNSYHGGLHVVAAARPTHARGQGLCRVTCTTSGHRRDLSCSHQSPLALIRINANSLLPPPREQRPVRDARRNPEYAGKPATFPKLSCRQGSTARILCYSSHNRSITDPRSTDPPHLFWRYEHLPRIRTARPPTRPPRTPAAHPASVTAFGSVIAFEFGLEETVALELSGDIPLRLSHSELIYCDAMLPGSTARL